MKTMREVLFGSKAIPNMAYTEEERGLLEMVRMLERERLIDSITAELIWRTRGVFGLREINRVLVRSKTMSGVKAMQSVVNEYSGDEKKLVVDAIMSVLGTKAAQVLGES